MQRKFWLLLVSVVFFQGCVGPHHDGLCRKKNPRKGPFDRQKQFWTDSPAEVTITGVFDKSKKGPYWGFVDLSGISIGGGNASKEIETFKTIHTRHIVKMQITQGEKVDFKAYVGPFPLQDEFKFAEAKIKNTLAYVYLTCGWVYVSGDGPRVRTDWVDAGADGSTILVQIDESVTPKLARVFFLGGDDAFATYIPTNYTVNIPNENYYVEIAENGSITGPTPIPPPGNVIGDFVAQIHGGVLSEEP